MCTNCSVTKKKIDKCVCSVVVAAFEDDVDVHRSAVFFFFFFLRESGQSSL